MGFSIARIDHVVVNCVDVDVTADWFSRALGAEIEPYGAGRRAVRVGEQKLNLRPVGAAGWGTARQESAGSLDICFETDAPIGDVLTRWASRGIALVEGPTTRAGSRGPITSVYTVDPDGNLIEVATYREDAR